MYLEVWLMCSRNMNEELTQQLAKGKISIEDYRKTVFGEYDDTSFLDNVLFCYSFPKKSEDDILVIKKG